MQATVKFWDRIAPKYAKTPIRDMRVYERKLEITQQYLNRDMDVLEFGCGTGSTAIHHAPFVRTYNGTDIAPGMIRIAEKKLCDSEIKNVEFSVGTLQTAITQGQTFDAVLGLNVLHLMPDWPAQIEAIHALVRPGGLFISSTVCLKDRVPWLRFVAPLLRMMRIFPELVFFDKKTFRNQITQTGFTVLEDWTPDSSPATSFVICRKTKP